VLQQCNYLVLDEADRMVDMGFEEDLKFILSQMPGGAPGDGAGGDGKDILDEDEPGDQEYALRAQRQEGKPTPRTTILYSATMPPAVERIARQYLWKPVGITIGSAGKPVDRIEQRIVWVPQGGQRTSRLLNDLHTFGMPAIVFCNQRAACDSLQNLLRQNAINSTVLHAGKSQDQREASLTAFRGGKYDVLVATNVAGRGIDIPGIRLVVNYECPANIEVRKRRVFVFCIRGCERRRRGRHVLFFHKTLLGLDFLRYTYPR
jgi:ATP-dependent RNA helicase DDX23/PRP28